MSFEKVEIGNCTLYRGDCLEMLPTLSGVDAVIADPPYGTTRCRWDNIIPLDRMWEALKFVRRKNTPIILSAQSPFDKVLGSSNIKEFKYELIWEKTNATGHLNAKKMPMKAHENILVFYQSLPTYNPQKTLGHIRKSATKTKSNTEVYGKQNLSGIIYDSTERYPRSVLKFPSDKQRTCLHPTQKPVALYDYLIRTFTNENDVVLDFCMGSGTAGVSCIDLNRKFIGIEIEPKYFNIACKRIEGAYKQLSDFKKFPKEIGPQEVLL